MKSSFSRFAILLLTMVVLTVNAATDDWPQWRGPFRTGHAAPSAAAVTTLPSELQPEWKIAAGGGFSAPIVAGGKLVYLDEHDGHEYAHLVDANTGKEIWKVAYAESFQDEWGAGPRSTPIIEENRIYALACNGEFRCLNLANGKVLWQTSFERDFRVKFLGSKAKDGTASRRGNNGSGVIYRDTITLPVGNTEGASLVCFNKFTGAKLWQSQSDEAAYSSFLAVRLAGADQIVAFTADALLGLKPENGSLLWRVPMKTDAKRHAASPVIFEDTVMVNSQTIGLVAERISHESGVFKATEAWVNKPLKINLATPVEVNGFLYSQGVNKDYVCVDARTGKINWSQPGFGRGDKKDCSFTIAVQNNLLVLTYDGLLLLLTADPSSYKEVARLQVCGNTWSHPAYSAGRLFVRDGRQLLCLKLASGGR